MTVFFFYIIFLMTALRYTANLIRQQLPINTGSVVIVRFLGTTSHSSSARETLISLCTQISAVYASAHVIPNDYKQLIKLVSGQERERERERESCLRACTYVRVCVCARLCGYLTHLFIYSLPNCYN